MTARPNAAHNTPAPAGSPARPAVFVGSEIYRDAAFGAHHPLSGPRIAAVMALCEALGWLDEREFRASDAASVETLTRFHQADYVDALRTADRQGVVPLEVRERYSIGTMENPLFPGLFRRAATTVGGSVLAAELAMTGTVAFHPAGGTHHGRRDRASGFCYFNDPVFAIGRFLDLGLERVLYVDLDAHHGDGVQIAFEQDERVLTLSIHESGRWPYSGAAADRGQGHARNLPVPPGFNDDELDLLMGRAVLPLAHRFAAEAVVITCGADALAGDPLSGMALSNRALWRAVEGLVAQTPRAVVLGGGGYNPWTVARCWTGLWGRLSGRDLPAVLPSAAQAVLRGFECDLIDDEDIDPRWITMLADEPNHGPVRPELVRLAEDVLQ